MSDPVVDVACGEYHSVLLCNESNQSATANIFFSGSSQPKVGEKEICQSFESLPCDVSHEYAMNELDSDYVKLFFLNTQFALVRQVYAGSSMCACVRDADGGEGLLTALAHFAVEERYFAAKLKQIRDLVMHPILARIHNDHSALQAKRLSRYLPLV